MTQNPDLIITRPNLCDAGSDLHPYDRNGLDFWLNEDQSIEWIRTVNGASVPHDPLVYGKDYDVEESPHLAAYSFSGFKSFFPGIRFQGPIACQKFRGGRRVNSAALDLLLMSTKYSIRV